jgi:CelD/BcsL family acetyltransferase involved in cellulose biosynthesis
MDYQLFTQFSDFDALAGEWNALLTKSAIHVPFLRHEYLRGWWQTLGGGEWPQGDLAVVTARQQGKLIGAAPLFFTTNRENLPALMWIGSIEISDYLDVIALPEALPDFLAGMLRFLGGLSTPGWRVLDGYNLRQNSPTLPALQAAAESLGWECHIEPYLPCPHIPLPGDWEMYLAGIDKKQRHEIRRKMRRAEEGDIPVRWYIVTDSGALRAEVDAFLALMGQDEEKSRFLTPAMRQSFHTTARAAFDAGWLQLAFLTVNGEKACGYFNFDYDNQIWVYNSGIDLRFREVSPGWVLLGYLLQWANEHQRAAFDFMRGDEEYKYRFGGVNDHVMRVQVKRR